MKKRSCFETTIKIEGCGCFHTPRVEKNGKRFGLGTTWF